MSTDSTTQQILTTQQAMCSEMNEFRITQEEMKTTMDGFQAHQKEMMDAIKVFSNEVYSRLENVEDQLASQKTTMDHLVKTTEDIKADNRSHLSRLQDHSDRIGCLEEYCGIA